MERISLISVLRDYFERIFEEHKNMKVLVLDEETTPIVSLVISQTQILEKDVFLVEKIADSIFDESSPSSDKLPHLHAVYIIRPTEKNFILLHKAIAAPKYGQYHLYFTNKVNLNQLQQLAAADKHDIVRSVFEIFSDFYPLTPDVFHLNVMQDIILTKPQNQWGELGNEVMHRITDGIFSVLLALRKFPVIRYQRSSEVCYNLADRLHEKLREDHDLMVSYMARSGRHKTTIDGVDQTCVLLILDRREDPVTPLLHQWNYMGMLHELIGISNNRVFLRRLGEDDNKNIALSTDQDKFYYDNLFSNFGDLAMNISAYVEHYQ